MKIIFILCWIYARTYVPLSDSDEMALSKDPLVDEEIPELKWEKKYFFGQESLEKVKKKKIPTKKNAKKNIKKCQNRKEWKYLFWKYFLDSHYLK